MISLVIYTTTNYFLFFIEHSDGILIIFDQSKELKLKFSSAYKNCFRTKFSIKNYKGHDRKITSEVALWKTHLKKNTSRQMIIVVFCWGLKWQGLKWVLAFLHVLFILHILSWKSVIRFHPSDQQLGCGKKVMEGMRGKGWVKWNT